MSFTIQSAEPPDVPAFEITKRPILNTSVWGRPVICADCVGRIGTPVDIGRMSRLACVGSGASTTAARGSMNPAGPTSAPTDGPVRSYQPDTGGVGAGTGTGV